MNEPGSVAEWGERWLSEWVAAPGDSGHDSETREWLANGWRNWTLDRAMFEWTRDRRVWSGVGFDEHNANHAARGLVGLYRREGEGLLVWRMFREYRHRGLPVPEFILRKFDQWADRLENASGPEAVAAAIEMTGKRGGAQGAARLRQIDRAWRIASEVEQLRQLGMKSAEAYRRVATSQRMRPDAVKKVHLRWIKPARTAETAETRALRMLGKG